MIYALILLVIIALTGGIIYQMSRGFANRCELNATTVLGATDHFMNEDKKRAATVIVQAQAGNPIESQSNDGDGDRDQISP
jgi:hypothetical protein